MYFLSFIIGLLFSAVAPAYAGTTLHVEALPKVVKQGDACILRASGPASLTSLFGEFRGERFPMTSGVQKDTYEGLVGIDLNIRPGAYEIKVLGTDGEGKVYRGDLRLKVKKADFKTQRLSLPSPMVDLDAATLERVEREERQLKALFRGIREEKLWSGPFVRPVLRRASPFST